MNVHIRDTARNPLFPRFLVLAAFGLAMALGAALCFAAPAKAEDLEPDPKHATQTLFALTSSSTSADPAAAGAWTYELVSGDAVLGRLSVELSVQPCPVGECYVMTQMGSFEFSATHTRTLNSRAVIKPDFTLLNYEKTQEIKSGDEITAQTMRTDVGGLTVTTVTRGTATPEEKTIRKTGPVFLAPAVTLLLVRAAKPENNTYYTFDALIPDQGDLLPGFIEITGAILQKTDAGAQNLFRIRASNGESTLAFDVNAQGEIVRYGPETGGLEFHLVK